MPSTDPLRRRYAAVILVGALAVLAVIVSRLTPETAVTAPPDPLADDRSIAVLPFADLSADAGYEYFGDGIAAEIIDLLIRVPGLSVPARASSFAFRGTGADIETVASNLGVRYVLEGGVVRDDDRVRITVRVVDAGTHADLWSETYDRPLANIFAVQDDIARNIVAALKVTLNVEQEQALRSRRTASIDAYDHYLRGRLYHARFTRDDTHNAISMFERAIHADPAYAPARAWMAMALVQLYRAFDADPAHLQRAEALGMKAIELAPDLADARTALGFTLAHQKQFDAATRELEHALGINPHSASVHYFYGAAAYMQGRTARAAELWERAIEIDPTYSRAFTLLPQAYRTLGRETDVVETYRRLAEIARRQLEINPDDTQVLLQLATAEMVIGNREEAIRSANHIAFLGHGDPVLMYNAACLYSLAGMTDKAVIALERSHDAGLTNVAWIEQDSDLDAIRDDPRFQALVQRMRAAAKAD